MQLHLLFPIFLCIISMFVILSNISTDATGIQASVSVSIYCKEWVGLWFHSVVLLLILEWNPFLMYSCRHLGLEFFF